MSEAKKVSGFQIHSADNVATLLEDAEKDAAIEIRGDASRGEICSLQAIHTGHKVALQNLPAGTRVVKYGFPIGETTRDVVQGEWVHLHNCRSFCDELSSELSVETGSRKESRYV